MKHCCKNCHFLAKTYRNQNGSDHVLSWNQPNRDKAELESYYTAHCYRGVWDTGVNPEISSDLALIIATDRRDTCFFIGIQDSMLFPAAMELQKQMKESAQLKKNYRYTQIGLLLAGIALLVDTLLNIYQIIWGK